jgi:hypothetical protein
MRLAAASQAASAGPPDSRSTSRFFAITYLGGVIPVLAVGLLATRWDLVVAMTVFTVTAGVAVLLMAWKLTVDQTRI